MNAKLELVSFNLCPFVQRAVITLRHKDADFDITYIDLANKPDWFLKISPFGKVPVLRVGDAVLFESAVINEYLDETIEPRLHPSDPLRRAQNRAWIEFGSSALVSHYLMTNAEDAAGFQSKWDELQEKLIRVEDQLGEGPYFNGADFSLVDASYAPMFMRLHLTEGIHPTGIYAKTPKVKAWADALLALEAVQKSVLPEFKDLYRDYIKNKKGHLAQQMSA